MTPSLQAKRCATCQTLSLESSLACRKCGAPDLTAVSLSGIGTVYSYCSVQVPPTRLRDEAPYVLLIVELDGGPVALGRWASSGDVRIGQRVSAEADSRRPDLLWFQTYSDSDAGST